MSGAGTRGRPTSPSASISSAGPAGPSVATGRGRRAGTRAAFRRRACRRAAVCHSVRRSRTAWPSPRPPEAPRTTRQRRERTQLAPRAGAFVAGVHRANSHRFRATAPGSGSRPDMVGSCAAVSRERTVRKRASTVTFCTYRRAGTANQEPSRWFSTRVLDEGSRRGFSTRVLHDG